MLDPSSSPSRFQSILISLYIKGLTQEGLDRNPGLHPGASPMNNFSSFETRFGPAVTLIQLKTHVDKRGSLYSVEFFSLPFQPQRMFFVAPSKAGEKRGGHAHETAHQLLICASGQIDIVVAYAGEEEKFCLDRPGMAIHLFPRVWAEQTYASTEAVLLVLSSENYDPISYVDYGRIPKI
jgi:dTDP-4-dehydrorhamnose 3,5-epimerase-like enzyme